MHIVVFIIGLISAASVWYWRLQMVGRAASDVTDAVKTVVNLPRRLSFIREAGKSSIALIEDPRDAAAVMMVEIARADGELKQSQKTAILEQLCSQLALSPESAEETYVNACWIGRDEPTPQTVIEKLSTVIISSASIGEVELQQLDEMLTTIASVAGPISNTQHDLLEAYRKKAKLL